MKSPATFLLLTMTAMLVSVDTAEAQSAADYGDGQHTQRPTCEQRGDLCVDQCIRPSAAIYLRSVASPAALAGNWFQRSGGQTDARKDQAFPGLGLSNFLQLNRPLTRIGLTQQAARCLLLLTDLRPCKGAPRRPPSEPRIRRVRQLSDQEQPESTGPAPPSARSRWPVGCLCGGSVIRLCIYVAGSASTNTNLLK